MASTLCECSGGMPVLTNRAGAAASSAIGSYTTVDHDAWRLDDQVAAGPAARGQPSASAAQIYETGRVDGERAARHHLDRTTACATRTAAGIRPTACATADEWSKRGLLRTRCGCRLWTVAHVAVFAHATRREVATTAAGC